MADDGYHISYKDLLSGGRDDLSYPHRADPTHTVEDLINEYSVLDNGTRTKDRATIAGRIMAKRQHGKLLFLDLQQEGDRIQLFINKKTISDELYEQLTDVQIGDIYSVDGTLMKTKMGELSVNVEDANLLAGTVRQFPSKNKGFSRVEARYRQRYLDLLMNPENLDVFKKRSRIIRTIRDHLDDNDFLEVETPVLQPVYGGANAKPFTTFYNDLDEEAFLRVSNELYLKRLIIGGIDRVYEFAKDFRNESIDATHNPEFTQVEIYQAYADYTEMMDLVETLVKEANKAINGDETVIKYQGHDIKIGEPWERISMVDAVNDAAAIDWGKMTDSELIDLLHEYGIQAKGGFTRGKALNWLFEGLVEDTLIQPTIIYDYPVDVSPLAKSHRSKPGLVERFELFIAGKEFANAYSELNDPAEQSIRFALQDANRKAGDDEAHPMDFEFVKAMEYGMPPTGGLGIGIDRLTMLLTNKASIKEVILFPALRKKGYLTDFKSVLEERLALRGELDKLDRIEIDSKDFSEKSLDERYRIFMGLDHTDE